jgi:hypothetical protein
MTHRDVILWTCIRGLGLGVAAIPIMTWGVSAVPPERTNHASAISNVSQQIGGALALAALGTMITAQQAQLVADRSALIGRDSALGRLAGALLEQTAHMPPAMFAIAYRLGTMLQIRTMSTAFANMFVVVAVATVALVPLVYLMRPSAQPAGAQNTTDGVRPAAHGQIDDAHTDAVADLAEEPDLPQPLPAGAKADLPVLSGIGGHKAPTGRHRANPQAGDRAALRRTVTTPVSPSMRVHSRGRGAHRRIQRREDAVLGESRTKTATEGTRRFD